jgi:hypothetical protein
MSTTNQTKEIHTMKFFNRFKKTRKPTQRFDPEFLAYVKSIKIEPLNYQPIVVDNLRARADREYFASSRLNERR